MSNLGRDEVGTTSASRRWARCVGTVMAIAALLGTVGCARATPLPADEQLPRAEQAVQALQATYYNGRGRWHGAGYWNTANAFAVVLDEYQKTHSPRWLTVIQAVYRANSQHGRLGDFTSDAIDDEQWWGLDWVRAWDLTGNPQYLATAEQVFANAAATWDDHCGGGVWWNAAKTYKNAIPNELFLLLATQLHEVTPDDSGPHSYLAWAEQEADWFLQSGMINAQGLVNDGLTASCQNNGGTTWTYNQGVILAGLAELYHITGDHLYLDTAQRIADAAITTLVTPSGVLYETGCEPSSDCDTDQQLFKGIFVRYLWWFYHYDPQPRYLAFIRANLGAIWQDDRSAYDTFGLHWAGPLADITVNTDIEATEAFTATSIPLPGPVRRAPSRVRSG